MVPQNRFLKGGVVPNNVCALAGQIQGLARQAHAGYAASYVHSSCEMLDSEAVRSCDGNTDLGS